MVHNHSPEEGRGLDCPEYIIDDKRIGLCLIMAEMALND